MAQSISGSSTLFGFLTIAWDIDLSVPQVSITVTLNTPFGNKIIGSVVLNPQHPSVTVGGSVGPFTAQVTLSCNFSTMILSYDAELKVLPKTGLHPSVAIAAFLLV